MRSPLSNGSCYGHEAHTHAKRHEFSELSISVNGSGVPTNRKVIFTKSVSTNFNCFNVPTSFN
jgi:hypothetical protein